MKKILILTILLFHVFSDCQSQTNKLILAYEDIDALFELCPPTNLEISINDDCILLDFEIEGTNCGTFIGINVYINGEFIGTFEDEYEICEIPPGFYNLYITALYEEGESEPSNIINFEIIGDFPFYDDFENYTAGQQLACQNPDDWTTWENLPCSNQDPYITQEISYSGQNSIIIQDSNNLVKPTGNITEGRFRISFKLYIPNGFHGYFNTLQNFGSPGNSEYGMQVFFQDNSGAYLNAVTNTNFTYTSNVWFNNDIIVDLDHDHAQYYYENVLIDEWEWSSGGSKNGVNKFGGSNFYAFANNGIPKYFIDDYKIEQLAPLVLEAPENLQVNPLNEDLILTWSNPYDGIWLHYDNGNYGNGINAGGAPIYIAARYFPEDIEDLDGMFLTAIKFFAQNDDCIYSLRVWTGENAANTILEQDVLNFIPYSWNIVELNNPVLLDVSQELWIGNVCSSINYWDYYAACDDGPAISNKGDMISLTGIDWVSMSLYYALDYNWNIRGLILNNTDLVEIRASGSQITSSNNDKDNPKNSKSFLGYNIYSSINEGTFEMLDFTEDTLYVYPDPLPGTLYSFYVTSVYHEGESTASDTVSIATTGIQYTDKKSEGFLLYPNPAKEWIHIHSNTTIYSIAIYNIYGKLIDKLDNINTTGYSINTTDYFPGIYNLCIESESGKLIERMVIL
jgi:hypothetical protein